MREYWVSDCDSNNANYRGRGRKGEYKRTGEEMSGREGREGKEKEGLSKK